MNRKREGELVYHGRGNRRGVDSKKGAKGESGKKERATRFWLSRTKNGARQNSERKKTTHKDNPDAKRKRKKKNSGSLQKKNKQTD